jgi:hypothetical protein
MRARATLLGDVGPSAPDQWESTSRTCWLGVRRRCRAPRGDPGVGAGARRPGRGRAAPVQRAHELPGGKDHFGFFDGVSQPAIQGSGVLSRRATGSATVSAGWREVATRRGAAGPPRRGRHPPKAPHAPYHRNGTYVVLRKLAVDTRPSGASSRRRVPRRSGAAGRQDRRALADGTPLALAPHGPDERWPVTRRGSTTSATPTTSGPAAARWDRTSVAPTRATLRASSADGSAPGTASSAAGARTATRSRPA